MTSQEPKVLVFSPTYEGKDYIFDKFWNAIQSINYPNWEFIMIDNTDGLHYTHKLRQRGVPVVHVERGENSRQALSNAQNYAREKAISEGFDYILSVESDLIVTPDVITRLVNYDKPVVGATYYIGHEFKIPCIFFVQQNIYTGDTRTRLMQPSQVKSFLNTGLRRVHGMGVGCTLIRRDIFTRFMFWHDERFPNKHSDVYFYMELENNGIPVYVDTDYIIEHYPSKWEDVKDR
ncbi:MAG TPA: glycosyltransferase [Allocoleopsis sp.]